jgi:hypothetical protein
VIPHGSVPPCCEAWKECCGDEACPKSGSRDGLLGPNCHSGVCPLLHKHMSENKESYLTTMHQDESSGVWKKLEKPLSEATQTTLTLALSYAIRRAATWLLAKWLR